MEAARASGNRQTPQGFAGLEAGLSLLCRTGAVLCALPVEHVIETMRLPPLDALSGAPHFIAGVAVVRGGPLPVIFVNRLFGNEEKLPGRLVVVRAGERRIGLAVDAVVDVRTLSPDMLQRLPPLLRDASHHAVADIGTLDGELLVVLEAARVVPADLFALVEAEAAAS
jgi:purine-binding chemotaxis protein CheW